jgi:uncharacterized membrane protein YfcA
MDFWVVVFIIFFGSSLACFVQKYVGFAYGLISLTIWISFIETKTAIILSLFGAFIGQCINFKKNKNIKFKTARFFLLGGILGMLLSFYIFSIFDFVFLKAGLGGIMMLFFLGNIFLSNITLNFKERKLAEVIVGGIGGGMGIFGAGFGMAPSIWCTINNYTKESYFSIIILFNLMVICFSFLFHFEELNLKVNSYSFIIILISIFISNLIFDHLNLDFNIKSIRTLVSFIVLLQGLLLIFEHLLN